MSGYGRRSSNRRRIGWSSWLGSNPARASWRFRAAPAWSHGRLLPWWAAPVQVIATDISERMVERTAAEATRRGLSQVACRRMDAETIDEADASFDAVVCALGLMYVPEVATALGEMYRVLAPGGRVVAAVWGARARCGWAEVFPIVESRVASDVCPMFFQSWDARHAGQFVRRARDS